MKSALDKIIYKFLLEQTINSAEETGFYEKGWPDPLMDTELQQKLRNIKTVPANVTGTETNIQIEKITAIPIVKKAKIVYGTSKYVKFAKSHGAAENIWSAFSIQTKFSRKFNRVNKQDNENSNKISVGSDIIITDTSTAIKSLLTIFNESDDNNATYFGPRGAVAQKAKSEQLDLVYVVGPDVSKRKNFKKQYIWVLDLTKLNEFINLQPPSEITKYGELFGDVRNTNTIMNSGESSITVYYYTDLIKYFNYIKKYADSKQLKLPEPDNSNLLFPELQYLNSDPDSVNTDELLDRAITITNENAKQYNSTKFRGNALLRIVNMNQLLLIPQNGSIPFTETAIPKYNNKGELIPQKQTGIFTGIFENGMPKTGKIRFNDTGVEYEGTFKSNLYTGQIESGEGQVTLAFSIDLSNLKPRTVSNYKIDDNITFTGTMDARTDTIITGELNITEEIAYTIKYVNGKPTTGTEIFKGKKGSFKTEGTLKINASNEYEFIDGIIYYISDSDNSTVKYGYIENGNRYEYTSQVAGVQYPYTSYKIKNKAVTVYILQTNTKYVYVKDPLKKTWLYVNRSLFEAAIQDVVVKDKNDNDVILEWLPVTDKNLIKTLNTLK